MKIDIRIELPESRKFRSHGGKKKNLYCRLQKRLYAVQPAWKNWNRTLAETISILNSGEALGKTCARVASVDTRQWISVLYG